VNLKQGEIYLVNFGKKYNSEIGKIRPAVIIQNNFLNKILPIAKHKSILVIPLTTDNVATEFKIKITKRDKLKKDSYIIATWICALDLEHILLDKGVITKLTDNELDILKQRVYNLL